MKEYQYKLPYDAKRRMMFFAFGMVCFVLLMGVITYRNYSLLDTPYPWAPLILLLFIPVLVYFYWKSHKKYASVVVSIKTDDETIATKAPGLFEVVIRKGEVLAIHELPNRTLIVAKDRKTRILVPSYMEGYEEVRLLLGGWAAFIPVKSLLSFVSFYRVFPVIVFLSGLLGSLIFKTYPALGFFVVFCTVGGLHTFYILHKLNKSVPRIGRARWLVLFIIVVVLIKACNVYLAESGG